MSAWINVSRENCLAMEVATVPQAGWAGVMNSDLLRSAQSSFDVFVTVDRNLYFQQNVTGLKIAVVVLSAKTNRLADPKPLAPKLLSQLGRLERGKVTLIAAE